jgi:uncharacterized membrane protein YtjA (UPF0391 family)
MSVPVKNPPGLSLRHLEGASAEDKWRGTVLAKSTRGIRESGPSKDASAAPHRGEAAEVPPRFVGPERRRPWREEKTMLYWALVFLVVALVAALFGFGGVATAAAGFAKILFFIFLILFLVSLVFGGLRRSSGRVL